MKEQMGGMITKPMTRDEAIDILAIEVAEDESVDHEKVMERFEVLFEKNLPEKGGSFYVQSKIYFAKQHLMQDFPAEYDISKFNPGQAGAAAEADEAKEEEAKKEEEQKDADKKENEETKEEEKKEDGKK